MDVCQWHSSESNLPSCLSILSSLQTCYALDLPNLTSPEDIWSKEQNQLCGRTIQGKIISANLRRTRQSFLFYTELMKDLTKENLKPWGRAFFLPVFSFPPSLPLSPPSFPPSLIFSHPYSVSWTALSHVMRESQKDYDTLTLCLCWTDSKYPQDE